MPEISLFYGIRITMNYNEHNPPHFHAAYAGEECVVNILECCVMSGRLPRKQLRLLIAWAEIHQDELMQNWELSRDRKPLYRIAPLS